MLISCQLILPTHLISHFVNSFCTSFLSAFAHSRFPSSASYLFLLPISIRCTANQFFAHVFSLFLFHSDVSVLVCSWLSDSPTLHSRKYLPARFLPFLFPAFLHVLRMLNDYSSMLLAVSERFCVQYRVVGWLIFFSLSSSLYCHLAALPTFLPKVSPQLSNLKS